MENDNKENHREFCGQKMIRKKLKKLYLKLINIFFLINL